MGSCRLRSQVITPAKTLRGAGSQIGISIATFGSRTFLITKRARMSAGSCGTVLSSNGWKRVARRTPNRGSQRSVRRNACFVQRASRQARRFLSSSFRQPSQRFAGTVNAADSNRESTPSTFLGYGCFATVSLVQQVDLCGEPANMFVARGHARANSPDRVNVRLWLKADMC